MAHRDQGNPSSYGFFDDADIILRSSDNVDFYVIGAHLRYVSPVFKDMFALSRSDDNEKKDNLPIVPLTEDSETLRLLLDIIYPYEEEPQLSSLIIAWKVSKAAQKYLMNIIERKLKKQIANSKLFAERPLSIYAIAIDLEWEEVAINAARRTLNIPLPELAYVDELQSITGAGFCRFLEYRRLCENSKSPQEVALPPLRRHEVSIETCTSSSESDASRSDHIPSATASEPYTHSELSDLILRTSDGVDFYVVAALLRLSSPFFNRRFPLRNPVMRGGLAVMDVEEDSSVLRLLLSFVYPTPEPDIQSTRLYARVAFAARKYEMVNIEDRIRKHATASSLVTAEPFRVYAVASALGWTSLAKTAALNTLNTNVYEFTGSYVNEMHLITGAQLFHLIRFRFACADAACSIITTYPFKSYGFGKWLNWKRLQPFDVKVPDVLYQRLKTCPRGSTVLDVYERGLSNGIADTDVKSNAAGFIFLKILQCMQDTPKIVEEVISKVDLPS